MEGEGVIVLTMVVMVVLTIVVTVMMTVVVTVVPLLVPVAPTAEAMLRVTALRVRAPVRCRVGGAYVEARKACGGGAVGPQDVLVR